MPEYPTSQAGVYYTNCCTKRGSLFPEGNVEGTVGCWYRWYNGVSWAMFYKETDDGTESGGKTGWINMTQLS